MVAIDPAADDFFTSDFFASDFVVPDFVDFAVTTVLALVLAVKVFFLGVAVRLFTVTALVAFFWVPVFDFFSIFAMSLLKNDYCTFLVCANPFSRC